MSRAIDTRRHRAALPAFTPTAVSAEALAARTVGRDVEIERLVRAVRTAATTASRPHQLIVGPRGSGKTHLIAVAVHQALQDEQVANRVAVAVLPEDAVEIAGYEDLLVAVIDRMEPRPAESPRDEARDRRAQHDVAGLEQLVAELLGDRVLLLGVENLDRVFGDLGDRGQARLRNFTETSASVVLFASTPLLFDAVSDHERPWYGSFAVEHLRELDADEGRDLLRRIALAAGDDDLAAMLDTPTGRARVRAVEHLAGGSPRMWTVLAGCMTVELLDELVPLVEALFDELAPYYQQRLWELAGVERKLVHELCRSGSATVKDLAHATGLSQRAAATSLGRLHDARWVRREKRAGTDRRTTWYSLREPLLRHHVEYRAARGGQLPAIVGFLRSWFQAGELAGKLAGVHPGSLAEVYVLAALSGNRDPLRRGAWPVVTSVEALISAARAWIAAPVVDGLASFATGVVAEAVGVAARDGLPAARQAAATRLGGAADGGAPQLAGVIETAVAATAGAPGEPIEACRRGLEAASAAECPLAERDRVALGLLAGSFALPLADGDQLDRAADRLGDNDVRLRLMLRAYKAISGLLRDPATAIVHSREALLACAQALGADDPTTHNLLRGFASDRGVSSGELSR